jgi:PAS domain S-box-containing protein
VPDAPDRGDDEGPATVLIVDDHPETLVALRAVLEDAGHRVVAASSGEAALKAVLRETPSLIFLDVVMPIMSGFEVAELLRQRERSSRVPIVFLTGTPGEGPVRRAYAAGAVDYLEKPVAPEVVRAKARSLIALYRRGEAARRRAEEERRAREAEVSALRTRSERRYRNLAEAIPIVVWTADADGRLTYVNERFVLGTGLTPEEAAGSGWIEAVHPDDREGFTAAWRAARIARAPLEAEARLRAKEAWRWHLWRAAPELEGDAVVAWLGTSTDIEDQKRAQQELSEARARAEELYAEARRAVEVREDFLSVASHELKTPIAALSLQLETMVRSVKTTGAPPKAELAAKLERAFRLVGRLVRLIEQLLDVTRISDGRIELSPEPTDLSAVVRDVASRLEEDARRSGTTIVVDADGPVVGRWDPLRVEQVALNLLSNAVKYGAGRPVEVRVAANGEESARLEVADHGIGIAEEDQARIFDRFERAVPSSEYGGLGLGLWIARQIVQAHAGSIGVESAPGEGATFTVDLPRTRDGDGQR